MLKRRKGNATQPSPIKRRSTRSTVATLRSNHSNSLSNSATSETSQRTLKQVLRLTVRAKHPHNLHGATLHQPPQTQEYTPFRPFVLERELRNYHNKAFVKQLINDLAASISKHVYGKYQVNSFFYFQSLNHLLLICMLISNSKDLMACCMAKSRMGLVVLQYYLQ